MELITSPQGEQYIEAVNGFSFMKTESAVVFEKVFKKDVFEPNTLNVIVGTDSGLLVSWILENHSGEGRRYVFIERQDVLDTLGLSNLAEAKIDFLSDSDDLTVYLERFPDYFTRQSLTLNKSLAVIDKRLNYADLFEIFKKEFSLFTHEKFSDQSHEYFINTQLMNLADLHTPASVLKDKFLDQNVVILAGGPSLDDAIEWVKAQRPSLFVMSVGRISKRLQAEGIVPDFVTTVDPSPLSFDNSKELLEFPKETVFLYSHHSNPSLISQWWGRSAYVRELFPWDHANKNVGHNGNTVTNMALDMAVHMGFSNIYLAGADFCFLSDGTSHESNSFEAQSGHKTGGDLWVKNNAGQEVPTSKDFYQAHDIFEKQIMIANQTHPKTQFISLSGKSRKIEGVQYQQAETLLLPVTLKTDLNSILPVPDKAYLHTHIESMLEEVKAQIQRIHKARKIAQEAYEFAIKMVDSSGKISKNTNKILKLKSKLEAHLGDDQAMLFYYSPVDFYKVLEPLESDQQMTPKEIQKVLVEYFSGFKVSSEAFIDQLEKAQGALNDRFNEFSPHVELAELVAHWIEHDQPRRVHIWLDRLISEAQRDLLGDDSHSLIEQCDEHWVRMIKTKSVLESRFESQGKDPNQWAKQVMKLFERNDSEKLLGVSEELLAKPDVILQALGGIAQGLYFQVSGQLEAALEAYLSVEVPEVQLLVLQRRLDVAMQLQKTDVALQTLEKLSAFDVQYMAKFADLLAVLGNKSAAQEVYQMYLTVNPSDEEVRQRLNALLAP